ncbi:MAG: NAD(P)-binding protein, partial [Acidobacteria bacterium]|nr:NAD(P)-binding protein [Acidobacteriota bacterium]
MADPSAKTVAVVGGGLAGLSASVALADAGFRVRLFEKRPHLGGRASSYDLPNGEHVDNCQHVTMGCCTNLEDFYRRVGAAHQIRYYDRIFFLDREGRRGVIESSWLSPPLHLSPSFAVFPSLNWSDKRGIGNA